MLTDKIFPCQNSKKTTIADNDNYSEFLDAVASLASGHDCHSLIKVHNKTQGFRVKLQVSDRDKIGTRQGRDRDKTGIRQGQDRDKTGTRQGKDRDKIGTR